jgi:SAM-dependent methyltransferase
LTRRLAESTILLHSAVGVAGLKPPSDASHGIIPWGKRGHLNIEAIDIYSERAREYLCFVNAVAYPKGIRAYFRRSPFLSPGIKVLDAGCGTGIAALELREAMLDRGLGPVEMKCFDVTPSMLDFFREKLHSMDIDDVEVVQADVLNLTVLPDNWNDFDLIVSAAMMEYLPKTSLVEALSQLRLRLRGSGSLILFVTRDNWFTRPLIGRWWKASCYQKTELEKHVRQAGFSRVNFSSFPVLYKHLSLWGHIIEAS